MEWTQALLLIGAGLAGGFVGGLVGVGGGIIFAPVLFFYYQGLGVAPDVLTPLTIGSSLFCTLLVALSSAWFQLRKEAVEKTVALQVGLASAVAVYLMTRFVTTQPWYDATVFQVVFSLVLFVVIVRMVSGKKEQAAAVQTAEDEAPVYRWPVLVGTGTAAGAVASAVGVGGGIVMVPAYAQGLHLPMHRAVGTSSATIVLISLAGVFSYAWAGLGAAVPSTALGYVDVGQALLLGLPAVVTARVGVWVAHRIDTRALRLSFAFLALLVAVRLLWRAFG